MDFHAGLFDQQGPNRSAASWTAKLRATKTNDHMLNPRTDLGSGHFGASGRYDYDQE